MLLRDRPWYYRKGEEVCQANYTSEARDYESLGYKRIDKSGNFKNAPEPVAVATEPEEEGLDLEGMTRVELLKFAEENGIEVKSNSSKAEILKACLGGSNE